MRATGSSCFTFCRLFPCHRDAHPGAHELMFFGCWWKPGDPAPPVHGAPTQPSRLQGPQWGAIPFCALPLSQPQEPTTLGRPSRHCDASEKGPFPVSALWSFLDQDVVLTLVMPRFPCGPQRPWVRLSAVTPTSASVAGSEFPVTTPCDRVSSPSKPKAQGLCL